MVCQAEDEIVEILDELLFEEENGEGTTDGGLPEDGGEMESEENSTNSVADNENHPAASPPMEENGEDGIICSNFKFSPYRISNFSSERKLSHIIIVFFNRSHFSLSVLSFPGTDGNEDGGMTTQHEDNRPFCGLCGKSFARKWNLKRHNDKIHPKVEMCLICKKAYQFQDNLINHVNVSHKDARDEFQLEGQNHFSCKHCGEHNFKRNSISLPIPMKAKKSDKIPTCN